MDSRPHPEDEVRDPPKFFGGEEFWQLAHDAQRRDRLDHERQKDQGQKRILRWVLAGWALFTVTIQMIVLTVAFWYIGSGKLTYDSYQFQVFLVGTLGEAFGIVYVIAKYLYPRANEP